MTTASLIEATAPHTAALTVAPHTATPGDVTVATAAEATEVATEAATKMTN